MFEQTFKNLDDILRKEDGCNTELDYAEQTSWLLFLKYLDDLETERAMEAQLKGKTANQIIDTEHRWGSWAAPKDDQGNFDHNTAATGDDLITYVKENLFPYLASFRENSDNPNTIEYKIGSVFSEIRNRFESGYSLRKAIELIDELHFRTQAEKDELGNLYETRIKNMGNAGRTGGQYYTPRPLIRAMIDVVKPEVGETIYDPACGSAGFLCESYVYLRENNPKLSTAKLKALQTKTLYGKEKKSLAFILGVMNMILHGVDAPNIAKTNTLSENLADVQAKDQVDIVLANPPFGSEENKEVEQNFTIRSGETAYLFLQHFMKYLKPGGRAAVVIKNTFLSNSDNASKDLRQELLESCNLHTVLDLPSKVFTAGVRTVVLFFEKGSSTQKTWFYQLDPGRSLGKTNPLNDDDLKEFVELQKTFADSEQSWTVKATEVDQESFDLSVKNPNAPEEEPLLSPEEILDEIERLDQESAEVLAGIREML